MITHSACFLDSLRHRLHQCRHLAQGAATLAYVPEITVRTLKDSYRLIFQKEPRSNTPRLCQELGIELSPAQEETLLAWEDALRGEEKYTRLSVHRETALELIRLMEEKLKTL